jgi:hypothetical protein
LGLNLTSNDFFPSVWPSTTSKHYTLAKKKIITKKCKFQKHKPIKESEFALQHSAITSVEMMDCVVLASTSPAHQAKDEAASRMSAVFIRVHVLQ